MTPPASGSAIGMAFRAGVDSAARVLRRGEVVFRVGAGRGAATVRRAEVAAFFVLRAARLEVVVVRRDAAAARGPGPLMT